MDRHLAITALLSLALLSGCKRSAEPLAQADATLGQPTGSGSGSGRDDACRYVEFPTLPGASFMVESGVITRADADESATNTLGAKVGDSVNALLQQHPGAQRMPHKYEPDGEYLSYPGAKPGSALVLETRDGKVTKIRAGLEPAVHYVEGCG